MPDTPRAVRDTSIDIAKGLAITAIVFGHVWLGLEAAGLIADQHLFEAVETTLYLSHLSVFAFTAGLFVQRGMQRVGPWRYALERDATFLWLYLLWTVIQGAVKLAASSVVNSPTSVSAVLRVWTPDAQLWFFGWIAVMMLLTAVLRPWESKARSGIAIAVAAFASLSMWGLDGGIIGSHGLGLTVFFVAATIWRGDRFLDFARDASPLALIALAALGIGGMVALGVTGSATPPTIDGEHRTVVSVLLGLLASTVGTLGVLALARVLARTRGCGWLAFVGKNSLQIFVAHIVCTSGSRIVLAAVGADDLLVQAAIGTVAGVAVPLAMAVLTPRLHLGWLFDLPRPVRSMIAVPRGGPGSFRSKSSSPDSRNIRPLG